MTDKKALEVLHSWLKLAYHNADGTDEDSAELYEALQTVFALISRQKTEVAKLKKEKYRLNKALNQSEDYRLIAKSEARREFAEKAKMKCSEIYDVVLPRLFAEIIDSLLKEMESESNV